jgi:hypothetical protein
VSESHTHTYIMPFGIVRKLLAEDERLAQLTPLWLEFLNFVLTLSGIFGHKS